MNKLGTLVFFCGKMGAGKSTKALEMTRDIDAIVISEDDWLAKLYPEEINNFNDYIKYSSRLKPHQGIRGDVRRPPPLMPTGYVKRTMTANGIWRQPA